MDIYNQINPRAKRIESEHALKNEISYQQAFLIMLLSEYFTITIKRQSKKCTITCPTPIIDTLTLEGVSIEVKELTQKQCELIAGSESLTNKTNQRRFSKNKQYFMQNFLIDSLREFGYYFHSKYSKPTSKTIRLERIKNVYINNILIYSQEDIKSIGKTVNEHLITMLQNESWYVIPVGNSFMSSFRRNYQTSSPVSNTQ